MASHNKTARKVTRSKSSFFFLPWIYDSATEVDADLDDTSKSSALHETGSITPFDRIVFENVDASKKARKRTRLHFSKTFIWWLGKCKNITSSICGRIKQTWDDLWVLKIYGACHKESFPSHKHSPSTFSRSCSLVFVQLYYRDALFRSYKTVLASGI